MGCEVGWDMEWDIWGGMIYNGLRYGMGSERVERDEVR